MRIVALLLSVLIAGCVATGQKFSSVVDSVEGKGSIYLLRQTAFVGFAYCPPVTIDGKKIGCLKNGGYIQAYIDPGKHELRFEKRALEVGKEHFIDFEIKAGETQFYEWTTFLTSTGFFIGGVYSGASFSESIRPHTKESAESVLLKLSGP